MRLDVAYKMFAGGAVLAGCLMSGLDRPARAEDPADVPPAPASEIPDLLDDAQAGQPIAPAHEPRIAASSTSPRLRISSASNNSRRNSDDRLGSYARVARAATVGRTPVNAPKFDSMPQMPTMMDDATP